MKTIQTCPNGHTWELESSERGRPPGCPVCGSAGAPATVPGHNSTIATPAPATPAPATPETVSACDDPFRTTLHRPAALTDPFRTRDPSALSVESRTRPALASVPGHEVLAELGRGGMGVVYQARQVALKRMVALKMILAGSHAGAAQQARFRVEAEAVARLQHPNIVQIYEIGETEGCPFFSMEFVSGGNLAKQLDKRPLPAADAARLAETLARAVQHAHQRGVIHRDLKPVNILLTEDGIPKITDFGLAKQLESDAGQTRSGDVMGTPSYMAPEQAAGNTEEIGPRADVYSLGAILYEMLSGRPPFRGVSAMETLRQVMHDEVTPPSRHHAGCDRVLETICLKALAKDPQQRYASALALAQDLERYRAGEPILARRAGLASRVWRRARRHPVKVLAAPLLLLLIVVAGLVNRELTSTRSGARLLQQFDESLPETEWTAEAAERVDRVLGEWETLDAEQAGLARRKLIDRFAALFRTGLKKPRLEGADVARLQGDLAWLAGRDPELAQALERELGQRGRAWQPRFELKHPWPEYDAVFGPGQAPPAGDVLVAPHADAPALTRIATSGRARLEASFDERWQDSGRLGLLLNAAATKDKVERGYAFRLSVAKESSTALGGESAGPSTAGKAKTFRQAAGAATMEILRNGVVLRGQPVVIAKGALVLSAWREGDRLQFQVNDGQPIVFFDVMPLRGAADTYFGLDWPAGVGLREMRASVQALPEAASPLERGDQFFEDGRYAEAMAMYQEQLIAAPKHEAAREARCKAALCLLELKQEDEAAALLGPLAAEAAGRWSLVAACRLWLIRMEHKQYEETAALSATVRAHFRPDELASYIGQDSKNRLLTIGLMRRSELFLPNPKVVARLEEQVQVADMLGGVNDQWGAHYGLARSRALVGADAQAAQSAAQAKALALESELAGYTGGCLPIWSARVHAWLQRRQGASQQALADLDAYTLKFADILRRLHPNDPKIQMNYAPLGLERARLLTELKQWTAAENEVDAFLKLTPDPIGNYTFYGAAWLMKGFLCERRGANDEAQRAWKAGLPSTYRSKVPGGETPTLGMEGMVCHAILASLTDQLSDADAEALWQTLGPALGGDSFIAQVLAQLRPSPAVLRGAWRTPNGKECARRFAFLDAAPAEYNLLPAVAGVAERMRQDALGGATSPEQDEVVWQATRTCFDFMQKGKLSQAHLLQLAFAWKGQTGFVGWGGVAPKLDPALRGPLAYVLGHRYQRLKSTDQKVRRADALMFFRTALKDAPPGSPLQRLALQDAKRLEAKISLAPSTDEPRTQPRAPTLLGGAQHWIWRQRPPFIRSPGFLNRCCVEGSRG
jgi:hypothetical protein